MKVAKVIPLFKAGERNEFCNNRPVSFLPQFSKILEKVFIDLKKAFDTIDHTILVEKLKYNGVRGVALSWISSYLSNRTQYVSNNNIASDRMNIACGVPQCSILGPIIFLPYINDLCSTSKILKFVLFADDTNILCTGKNKKEVILNYELCKLKICGLR